MKKLILASMLILVSVNANAASRLVSNSTNLAQAYIECTDDKCKATVIAKRDKAIIRNEKKVTKYSEVVKNATTEIELLRKIAN